MFTDSHLKPLLRWRPSPRGLQPSQPWANLSTCPQVWLLLCGIYTDICAPVSQGLCCGVWGWLYPPPAGGESPPLLLMTQWTWRICLTQVLMFVVMMVVCVSVLQSQTDFMLLLNIQVLVVRTRTRSLQVQNSCSGLCQSWRQKTNNETAWNTWSQSKDMMVVMMMVVMKKEVLKLFRIRCLTLVESVNSDSSVWFRRVGIIILSQSSQQQTHCLTMFHSVHCAATKSRYKDRI